MHPMTEKKEELKDKAKYIRALKQSRKPSSENYTMAATGKARQAGQEYRYEHIAYCLVRGRTYEQIEQPREENKLTEYIWETKINKLYATLKTKVDEANAAWALTRPPKAVSNG
jgi:hypothetical protein